MIALRNLLRGRLLVASAGAAVLVLVATLAVASARDVGETPLGEVDPGIERVGEFALPDFSGSTVAIADFAGGPVFLYFWASWCAPCESEAPVIQALWPEFEAAGYTFVGINIIDHEADARAFIERHGLTFPMLRDPDGQVYLDFGVHGVPEAYFLRPGLEVERKYLGELSERELRRLLAEIAAPAP